VVLVNIDSALQSIRSTLEAEIEPINTDYACLYGHQIWPGHPELRQNLSAIGWLPKTVGNAFAREIPELDAQNNVVTELRDITSGCGSTRAPRYSYIVHNLHHVYPPNAPNPLANYTPIVNDVLGQIRVLVDQTAVCMDPGEGGYSGLVNTIASAQASFDTGKLALAKSQLQKLLDKVRNNKQVDLQLQNCFYSFTQQKVVYMNPSSPDGDTVPRNLRADLIGRTEHALYMFGRFLGVLDANLPDDFEKPAEWQ
jgi:hypothetical protein